MMDPSVHAVDELSQTTNHLDCLEIDKMPVNIHFFQINLLAKIWKVDVQKNSIRPDSILSLRLKLSATCTTMKV